MEGKGTVLPEHLTAIVEPTEPSFDDGVLIPKGEYRLKLLSHSTAIQFETPKLILVFQVTDLGEYHGVKLKAYFNVAALKGKARKKGQVKHKRTGDFMIQYFTIFPHRRLKRLDRVPMEPLYNSLIVAKVGTVKLNSKRLPLPEQLWYSKVERMIRVEK